MASKHPWETATTNVEMEESVWNGETPLSMARRTLSQQSWLMQNCQDWPCQKDPQQFFLLEKVVKKGTKLWLD